MKKIFLYIAVIYNLNYMINYTKINSILNRVDYFYLLMLFSITYILLVKRKEEIWSSIKKVVSLIFITFAFSLLFSWDRTSLRLQEMVCIIKNFRTYLLLFFTILIWIIRTENENSTSSKKSFEIFKERKGDLEYIKEQIENKITQRSNVIGINGKWGSGKTYLIDTVIEKLEEKKDAYEFIKINSLILNTDEIYLNILVNLESILLKNGIFTGFNNKISRIFLNGSVTSGLSFDLSNLTETETHAQKIENFKKSLFSCKKDIIIVFDDIDRIEDSEKIDKLFSIINELSDKNIISLVLFDLENLEKIDKKYSRNYLEKYIPRMIEITPMSYILTLERVFEKNKKKLSKELLISDLSHLSVFFGCHYDELPVSALSDKEREQNRNRLNIYERSPIYGKVKIKDEITPRKIFQFVKETSDYIEHFNKLIEKDSIVSYVFLKYFFFDDFYRKINDVDTVQDFERIFEISISLDGKERDLRNICILKGMYSKENIETIKKVKDSSKEHVFIEDDHEYVHFGRIKNIIANFSKIDDRITIENLAEKNYKFIEGLRDIEKKLYEGNEENKMEKIKDNIKSTLIRATLNYPLEYYDSSGLFTERKDKIISEVMKIHFLGRNAVTSLAKETYLKIYKVLNEVELDKIKENYKKLKDELIIHSSLFSMGKQISKDAEIMRCINIYGNVGEEIKLFNVIYEDFNEITDDILELLSSSSILKNPLEHKITDRIINVLSEGKYNLEKKKSVNFLVNNIGKFLYKKEIYKREYLPVSTDIEYINFIKDMHIVRKIGKGSSGSLEFIKRDYRRYKGFLDELENICRKEFKPQKSNPEIKVEYSELPENKEKMKAKIDELKDKTRNKQKEKLEEMYNQGYSIDTIDSMCSQLKFKKFIIRLKNKKTKNLRALTGYVKGLEQQKGEE